MTVSRTEGISAHEVALVMEDAASAELVEHAAPTTIWRGHGRSSKSAHESLDAEGAAVVEALTPAGLALLRQICDEAPGTWFHVHGVANLSQQISDDPHHRAACLLHDVGKLLAPEAFAENVPHPTHRPAPGILTGHVSHGRYLIRRAGLGGVFEQAVLEHHGTMVVAGEETYPGPIPQSQFTTGLMIADLLEALASQGCLSESLAHELIHQRSEAGQFHAIGDEVAQQLLGQLLPGAMRICAETLARV